MVVIGAVSFHQLSPARTLVKKHTWCAAPRTRSQWRTQLPGLYHRDEAFVFIMSTLRFRAVVKILTHKPGRREFAYLTFIGGVIPAYLAASFGKQAVSLG